MERASRQGKSALRKGDMVLVIAGGNSHKRPVKGQVGKILRFAGASRQRVVLEGLNMMVRHQRQTSPGKPHGKIQKEASLHLSNVMYYVEKIKKPAQLRKRILADGTRVRGYLHPETGEFVQIVEEKR